ncbi:MAG: ABC transporter permease [Candidatus Omnitrophica bacterium CG08_land_8_20_14_0_20_41_16]|uniref:Transport permease protein n=1 Tax=Candidatus Sherwoodlollariibacterium unditelluris TaxID=1974757 RepID=A0A2G9YHQ7_9BACT|nr:MAG: ABC transporter permease [Candidatus Omnitrophica bacterium CG23_combo_of_CG06-09_8_20_14_all_41_10]PIS34305.1 MAG: ABC transporter permease [Candidatus Omnitrophica bacterium CG08_land_8_20_14_0_20_41_16]
MFERIQTILIKEFKQVFRDPRMKTMIFIGPVLQVLIFGYAATTDVKNIPTAIYDLDSTPESRDVIRAFSYSKYFKIKNYVYSDKEEKELIDKSLVSVVLRFNHGFGRDLEGNKGAQIQLIVDGTDSNTAGIALSYAAKIIQKYSYSVLQNRANIVLKQALAFPSVDLRDRAWFNENLKSRDYFIPGVIAMLVTVTSLLLTALAIVREKEIGTMEQLLVSPIKPIEFILGKLAPFAVLSFIDLTFIAAIGVLWFKIPIRGSILLLVGSTCIYLLTTLGVGLFISTICSTQQEAAMSMALFLMPVNLLSGFMFPITSMPTVMQYLTYLNPLRYYLEILRGIFLKGIGIRILWPQILALLIIGTSVITLSSLRFHKRL